MNITTNRLTLVPITEKHINDVFENFNEKIITYMFPSTSSSIAETTSVVQNFINQREDNTDYVYAITLTSTNEFIGFVGLHGLKNNVPELGIWTKLNSHGNHYGREAIGGVINFAKTLGITKLCYPVDRRNTASRKIPLYYGGKAVVEYKEVTTPDGRVLEEEVYEIEI